MRDSGINQTELAKRMDSSPQDVTNWKSRGLPADQYAKAADAFGRSVDELLGRAPPITASPETVGDALELLRRRLLTMRPRKRTAVAELLADVCEKPDEARDTISEIAAILSPITEHKSPGATKRAANG